MDIPTLKTFLLWAAVLNIAMQLLWFFFLAFAHNWVYRVHTKWFPISEQQFNSLHYGGLILLKTATFFFYIGPYIALCIAT